MSFDSEKLKLFPTLPGVYLMKNREGKILYIGKAVNLKNRIRQYFIPKRDGRLMVPFLTAQVEEIDTIVVRSEKEALILENNLIKKHQPKYNALLKDDKTYFSLMINHKHQWPMIRVVRYKGKPPEGNLYFGPYTQGYAAKQTLELLRTLFPLRQCSDRELHLRSRPCILYDMKRCIAPCVEKCTKEEYDEHVKRVVNFLKGHDLAILRDLKKEMDSAVENLDFEKAQGIYTTILHIEATLETQRVEKAGYEDIDVLGIFQETDKAVLTQMIFREGKLIASNDIVFRHNAQESNELISSFILQHYGEKEDVPHEILTPVELKESEVLADLISEGKKRKSAVRLPKKGDKKSLVEMANANAKIKFQKEKELKDQKEQILVSMEEIFELTHFPEIIECFDNSNLSGGEPVSSLVVFSGGKPDKSRYRKFKIREAGPSDDYGALKEVLERRYKKAKEEDNLPDLLIIDGGKGHLNIALKTLSALDISTVDVIAVAKEEGRHDKGVTQERIFLPERKEPVVLKPHSPILFLIQQIRDEAHRFAITFQKKRMQKRSLQSALDEIPGIGPVKKKRLLEHFGSLKRILEADETALKNVKGITDKDIEALRNFSLRKKFEA